MFWMGLAGISFLFWSLLTWEYSFPKVGSNISEITVNTVVSSCSDSDMSHSEPTWILDLWVSVWHILLPEVILRTVGGCFLLHIMGQVKEKIYSLCVYMGEPVHESVQLSLCASAACALSVTFWEGHIPDVLRVTVSQRERGSQVEGGPWLGAQHQELYQSLKSWSQNPSINIAVVFVVMANTPRASVARPLKSSFYRIDSLRIPIFPAAMYISANRNA